MRERKLLGQQVGNYRLTQTLGRGGFAEVYLGEHVHLGTQAAIKILHATLAGNVEIEQFRSEARMVAHLVHPHIVQVLEFGVEDNLPFLVMRYAPGSTLRRRHPEKSQVSLPTIVTYVKQVAAALQYAHDQHLIHRDVKPENMLIGLNEEILLSDFGVAVVTQSSYYHEHQTVAGTAIYMAPEQIRGQARPASDQYALGVVVYEWITGQRPFNGPFGEVARQHLFTPPPPLSEHISDLPPAVEPIVFKALSKEPDQRFDSIWEFAVTLEHAVSSSHTNGSGAATYEIPPPASSIYPADVKTATTVSEAIETPESLPDPSAVTVVDTGVPNELQTRPLSRRTLLRGLIVTGLMGAGIAAGALIWRSSLHLPFAPTQGQPSPTAVSPTLGTILYIYRGHRDIVEAASWSPDSTRVASASKDKTVQIWNAANGGHVVTYTKHTATVDAVTWSPDGTHIVSGSLDKTVRIWNPANGDEILTYTGHTDKVTSAIWSPDGKYIASGDDSFVIQVWLVNTGALYFQCNGHNGKVWALSWSPDGKHIASASADMTVKIWDATTGNNIFTYRGHSDEVNGVAWSPDGRRIASASSDRTVQVWDATDGGNVYVYRGHLNTVWWLSWSPDGRRIASASSDNTVRVWDAADGSNAYIYHGHSESVYFTDWSPDGQRIISGGLDLTVQVWRAR